MRFYFRDHSNFKIVLIIFITMIVLSSINGCEGDGNGSNADSKLAVRMIGPIPEELALEIEQEFIHSESEFETPFLIGATDIDTLPIEQREAVLNAFDDDIPIVLLMPTLDRRRALLDLVGIEMTDLSNDIPDFWGIQTSRKFEIWNYVFAEPPLRQTTDMDISDYTKYPDIKFTNGSEVVADLYDSPGYQICRVEDLKKWLADGPARAAGETSSVADPMDVERQTCVTVDSDTPTLPDIADVLLVDMAKAQFNYLHNNYTIKVSARSVHQKTDNYFVITSDGILSGEKEWLATTTAEERTQYGMRNRGRVAHKYDIRFRVPNTSSEQVTEATVTIPKTVEGEKEVSNSFGWNLGGSVTGSAACKAGSGECEGKVGVELSGGVRADITTTFKVKDVKVENKSEDGHPGWLYSILPPEVDKNYLTWWFYPLWTFPKELSTSTFQPQMAWVWKISDSVRVKYPEGLPIVVEFQPELVHCYSQHIEGQGYYADARTVYLKPDERFSVQISLPWPPKNVLQ